MGRELIRSLRFRAATAGDAPVLAGMNHRLIRDEGHRNPMTVVQLEERMRGFLTGEYSAYLFEDDAGVAGYALFRREADHVYLRQFYVERDRRRGGVGRAAMGWLLANVWKDAPRLRLEVLCHNAAAIAFYRSLGFSDYCLTMELGSS